MTRWILLAGVLVSATAVGLGAFGAHGLKQVLPEWYGDSELVSQRLENWETAVRYQMYHGLALILIGLGSCLHPSRLLTLAASCFLLGAAIFSGSLYSLVLSGQTWWGAVTPLGGVLQLVGWFLAGCGLWAVGSSVRKDG